MTKTCLASLLAALLVLECASDPREREREGDHEREEAEEARTRTDLTKTIDAFAGSAAIPETLRIRVEWERNGAMTTAELFGDGGGTWNDEVALRLKPEDIRTALRALDEAHFGAMVERFGDPEPEFITMKGKVALSTGTTGKSVVQLTRGPQSEPFAALAARLLAIAQKAAPSGTTIESLAEGLSEIAAGRLPAAALRITAQRRDDRSGSDEPGWLLQTRTREATARPFTNRGGYGPSRMIVLTNDELRELATALRDADPDSLPPNLFAPMYTDLRVTVLNRSRDLQARRYAGVSRNTHGERQKAFDRAIDALSAIAQRTLEQGRPVPMIE